jgi:hypothetical protein
MAEFFTHLLRGRVIDAAQHFLRRPPNVNGLVRTWRRGPDGKLTADWHCEADRVRQRDVA